MTDEEQTRDEIEETVNDEEPVQETIIETITEEKVKPVIKAKSKAKAKPKIKITKEPIEPIEPIVEEAVPVVEDKPKNIDKNKQMVNCPACNLSMTIHTLKYIHRKKRILQRGSSRRNLSRS